MSYRPDRLPWLATALHTFLLLLCRRRVIVGFHSNFDWNQARTAGDSPKLKAVSGGERASEGAGRIFLPSPPGRRSFGRFGLAYRLFRLAYPSLFLPHLRQQEEEGV